MQNFDDLDIEGRNPSHLSEEDKEKEEYDRKRIMRCSVTAEDGALRPVYSETEDGDIWCHICNVALFGAHKLISHNLCNRHKMKLDEWPYPVMLWSKRPDVAKMITPVQSATISDTLAPGEPVPPGMEDQITRTTSIQMSLDRHQSSPLVGLEYLLELVDNDSCEPSYTCVLCDKRGDPRTVMAHITSYNHRITYLNRHFPTISRAITELPRTTNYKRGANEISVLVARRIEEKFGRMKPQLVEKAQFEKNKMQYIKRVYQDVHFRETSECTFMEVYDVRWVTNFEEKMAEVNGNVRKKDSPDKKIDDRNKKEEKKKEKSPKRIDSKGEITKSGFKMRIVNKDKMNLRKTSPKPEEEVKKSPKRPSDDTKSLSSLSSISSSPSPSRSRSRSPNRNKKRSSIERSTGKYRSSIRRSRERVRARSRSRSRSRSLQPLRERDKWDKYREQIRRAEETLDRALKFHEKNPEKHPSYPDEWKKFWNRRYKELQAEGSDPSKHDFKPEWIEFWNKRMREIHNEQLQQRKEEIRKRLELPEDKPPKKWVPPPRRDRVQEREREHERERSPAKRSRHHVESEDEIEYVGTKTVVKPDYYDRHDVRERDYLYSSYLHGRGSVYSHTYPSRTRPIYYATPYPVKDKSPTSAVPLAPVKEEVLPEDLEVVALLRLLTALEGQLGSLGPKIVSFLSKALAAEKAKPNSAEELLYDEEVSVLFETVKEKLKGQLFAGMVEKMAVSATKTAIQNIAKLLHKTSESKKRLEEEKKKKERELLEAAKPVTNYVNRTTYSRPIEITTPAIKSEPVSVPGVGTVDKVAIAQQIAAALVAQGRSNVSQEELETLINAVVGMAEASKHSDKPVTTADFVKGLTNYGTITPRVTTEPIKLITIEPAQPSTKLERPENLSDFELKLKLQKFKDLSTEEQHSLISSLKKLEASDPIRVEKLRHFVNLGMTIPSTSVTIKSLSPDIEIISKVKKSSSPFSTRKGNQNPTDDEDKWKPKLDMFAEEDDDMQKKKDDDKNKIKTIELSDDDDDYPYEDIYKAANKNVSESEKAKKSHITFSKSPISWSRSRSRSRSPPARQKETTKTNDPNAILNETKRLIANIMCDLPNKYVPKSLSLSGEKIEPKQKSKEPAPPGSMPFYNQDFHLNNQSRTQEQPMTYPNMQNQQFSNYPPQPQMFPNNSGYMDNGYNYQGYGNPVNQGQYGGPPNQYPQQAYGSYGAPQPAPQPNYVQQPPSQQYDLYMQQQRFY
ncbi:hypothetical protein PUN28_005341 [Cardiocondyla obscurior]|uniref:Uncharacterized protein n=1 Tax=Cardiocondyla obscurior TaxID=286306 RepID=A0AAW2GFE5_9HYME